LGIIGVLILIGGWEARRFFPYPAVFARIGIENWQITEFHEYFHLDSDIIGVVLDDTRLADLETPPVYFNGRVFIPVDFVRKYIDPFIFWDERARIVFTSTNESVTRWVPDPGLTTPIRSDIILIGESPYVSIQFLIDMYSVMQIEFIESSNMLILNDARNPIGRAAEITSRTANVRYLPNSTAFITERLSRGNTLTAFPYTKVVPDNGEYVRVRTSNGLLGFVRSTDILYTEPMPTPVPDPFLRELRPPAFPEGINMAWDLINRYTTNAHAMSNPLPPGLNVISPTWFNFDPYTLDVVSFGGRNYVEWAHSQGVEVWAKAFDSNHNISHAVLTSAENRQRAVRQLVGFVESYGLDGINVNFEHIRSTDGDYYLQFLRELAPEMRRIGAVLSVATFVPASWHQQYRHELVARTVDYVAIMTYDEHVPSSDTPGPVASLSFVERWVNSTLNLMPPEQVIMGLPFYTRIWRIAADGSHTVPSSPGMRLARDFVENWGVTPVWDSTIGAYFAEFVTIEDGEQVTYRIWIECGRSIEAKLGIFTDNNLAGVAGWFRGLESPEVWEVIQQSLR